MKKDLRSTLMGVIILALTIVRSPSVAQAAGRTAVVDDDLSCPGATFSNLQDAIDFVGAGPGKITVCPGTYRGQFQIHDAANVQVVGIKGAIIAPSFATSPRFTGVLLDVERASGVTVQGLTFDGEGALQTFGDPNAIEFFDASGTVQHNTVINWHRPGFALADVVNGKPAGLLHAIHAIGFTAVAGGRPVSVSHNTVAGYQERAIDLEGDLAVSVVGNKLTAGLPPVDPGTFTQAINLQPLGNNGAHSPTGTIKSNSITGHGGSSGSNTIDSGILARQVGSLTIASNTMTHLVTGVSFFANCLSPADSSHNVVKSNKISEVIDGIDVTAIGGFPGAVCDPHVDGYVITANKIVNNQRDPLDFGLSAIQFDIHGANGGQAFALDETVRGNTLTFFLVDVQTLPQAGGTITGTFAPNKVILAPPPA